MALGLLLAAIGMDTVSGRLRMTFGFDPLMRGVNFLVAVIGLFGISEILLTMEERLALRGHSASISLRVVLKVWKELPRYWVTLLRSLPSAAARHHHRGAIARSFMGYNLAKRFSKDPASFGKGRIEGVFAPRDAAHESGTAAFVPMLASEFTGSGTAAILAAALWSGVLNTGPLLFVDKQDFVWGLIACVSRQRVGLCIVRPRCRFRVHPAHSFSAVAADDPRVLRNRRLRIQKRHVRRMDDAAVRRRRVRVQKLGYRSPLRSRSCSAIAAKTPFAIDDRCRRRICASLVDGLVGSITTWRSPFVLALIGALFKHAGRSCVQTDLMPLNPGNGRAVRALVDRRGADVFREMR